MGKRKAPTAGSAPGSRSSKRLKNDDADLQVLSNNAKAIQQKKGRKYAASAYQKRSTRQKQPVQQTQAQNNTADEEEAGDEQEPEAGLSRPESAAGAADEPNEVRDESPVRQEPEEGHPAVPDVQRQPAAHTDQEFQAVLKSLRTANKILASQAQLQRAETELANWQALQEEAAETGIDAVKHLEEFQQTNARPGGWRHQIADHVNGFADEYHPDRNPERSYEWGVHERELKWTVAQAQEHVKQQEGAKLVDDQALKALRADYAPAEGECVLGIAAAIDAAVEPLLPARQVFRAARDELERNLETIDEPTVKKAAARLERREWIDGMRRDAEEDLRRAGRQPVAGPNERLDRWAKVDGTLEREFILKFNKKYNIDLDLENTEDETVEVLLRTMFLRFPRTKLEDSTDGDLLPRFQATMLSAVYDAEDAGYTGLEPYQQASEGGIRADVAVKDGNDSDNSKVIKARAAFPASFLRHRNVGKGTQLQRNRLDRAHRRVADRKKILDDLEATYRSDEALEQWYSDRSGMPFEETDQATIDALTITMAEEKVEAKHALDKANDYLQEVINFTEKDGYSITSSQDHVRIYDGPRHNSGASFDNTDLHVVSPHLDRKEWRDWFTTLRASNKQAEDWIARTREAPPPTHTAPVSPYTEPESAEREFMAASEADVLADDVHDFYQTRTWEGMGLIAHMEHVVTKKIRENETVDHTRRHTDCTCILCEQADEGIEVEDRAIFLWPT